MKIKHIWNYQLVLFFLKQSILWVHGLQILGWLLPPPAKQNLEKSSHQSPKKTAKTVRLTRSPTYFCHLWRLENPGTICFLIEIIHQHLRSMYVHTFPTSKKGDFTCTPPANSFYYNFSLYYTSLCSFMSVWVCVMQPTGHFQTGMARSTRQQDGSDVAGSSGAFSSPDGLKIFKSPVMEPWSQINKKPGEILTPMLYLPLNMLHVIFTLWIQWLRSMDPMWVNIPFPWSIFYIVGGFNPFEKYAGSSSWIISPRIGVNIKNIWVATNQFNIAPEKWWLEDDPFLLGFGNFSGAMGVYPWESKGHFSFEIRWISSCYK